LLERFAWHPGAPLPHRHRKFSDLTLHLEAARSPPQAFPPRPGARSEASGSILTLSPARRGSVGAALTLSPDSRGSVGTILTLSPAARDSVGTVLTLSLAAGGSVGSVLTLPPSLFRASPADGDGRTLFLILPTGFLKPSGQLELCGTSNAVESDVAVRETPRRVCTRWMRWLRTGDVSTK
jgi:hypothetical protein